jgi:regulator of RNase E activity RraA
MDNSNLTSTTRHEPPRSRSARSEIRKRFLGVDTANIADVLDQMGMLDQGLSAEFQPFPATAGRLAGWAYTIRGQMVPYEGTGDAAKMEACHGIGPDEISVWSGDGAGICYFGELIALGMKERGCVGALVDGGVRDVRWLGEHNFAVYACYGRQCSRSDGGASLEARSRSICEARPASAWSSIRAISCSVTKTAASSFRHGT